MRESKPTVCSVPDCLNPVRYKGLCNTHRLRLQRHGSTAAVGTPHERHGLARHPLYGTWLNMKQRCYAQYSDSYSYYGGRGIRMCDRWRNSFSAFLADVGERPKGMTLDRIDGNGNYEPGNVRWASSSTQAKNTKTRRDNVSGHKGISWDADKSRWRAYTGGGRSRVELGRFVDLVEAIAARHRATVNDLHVVCCPELEDLRRTA